MHLLISRRPKHHSSFLFDIVSTSCSLRTGEGRHTGLITLKLMQEIIQAELPLNRRHK
jgi:hypothetical protein